MASRYSIETVFKAIDRMSAPVSRMQNRVGKMTRGMAQGIRRADKLTSKLTEKLKTAGLAGAAAMAIFGGGMANVMATGMDFEQTLVNAAVKFPGEIRKGSKAFKELEATAMRVGATTEFSSSEAAQGLNYLAMAGFDANMAMKSLPGLVNLATASQTDLATASDIATDSLGALNMMTKDAGQLQKNLVRVSDVLALTTNRTNTNMEDLFEAIKDGGPVARAAGASIETVAAMIGTMANAGIKGTRAGTGLKNIFMAISAPGSEAAKVLKRLGVATVDAQGNVRDAVDVFQDFATTAAKLTGSQKMAVYDAIFGRIPLAAALNLTNAAKSMRDLRTEIEKTTGVTAKNAAVMRNTNLGRWKTLLSTIESIKLMIYNKDAGPLAGALDRITAKLRSDGPKLAEKLAKALAWVLDNLEGIAKWGVRFGKIIATIFAVSAALKIFAGVMTVVNVIMAANPVGLIVLAIAALIAAVAAAIIWWDELKGAFLALPGPVKVAIAVLSGPIGWVIGAAAMIMEHWEPIKQFFVDLWGSIHDIVAKEVRFMMRLIDGVKVSVNAMVNGVKRIGGVFGLGGDEEDGGQAQGQAPAPVIVSPAQRNAAEYSERVTTHKSEVTIMDKTGQAVHTGGTMGPGLRLQTSGDF